MKWHGRATGKINNTFDLSYSVLLIPGNAIVQVCSVCSVGEIRFSQNVHIQNVGFLNAHPISTEVVITLGNSD